MGNPDSPSAWSLEPRTALSSLSTGVIPQITASHGLNLVKTAKKSGIWVTMGDEENGFRETRSLT